MLGRLPRLGDCSSKLCVLVLVIFAGDLKLPCSSRLLAGPVTSACLAVASQGRQLVHVPLGHPANRPSHVEVPPPLDLGACALLGLEPPLGGFLDPEGLVDGLGPRLDLLLTPAANDTNCLWVGIDGGLEAAKGADQGNGVGLVDGPGDGDELDELVGVRGCLGALDGGEVCVLVGLVQLEIAGGLGGGPAQDQRDVVDEAGLGKLAERVLVVWDVDDCEQDAKVVAALEVPDARVYILGVEAVVLQTAVAAEEGARALETRLGWLREAGDGRGRWADNDTMTHLRNRAQVVRPRP